MRQSQRLGMATAGVLLGISAGLSLSHNAVHADTTDDKAAEVPQTAENTTLQKPYVKAEQEAQEHNTDDLLIDDDQGVTVNSDTDDGAGDATDTDQNSDEHKLTVKFKLPDGTSVTKDMMARGGRAEAIYELVGHKYKTGDYYNISEIYSSTNPEFDVTSVVTDDGEKLTDGNHVMPNHDLTLTVTIAPTGDRPVDDDGLVKKLNAYQKKYGLPKHIQHQGNGGYSQDFLDKVSEYHQKQNEEINKQLDEEKEKNQHKDQTKDDATESNQSKDDQTKDDSQTDNSVAKDDDKTNESSDNLSDQANGANKNQKTVTLTFNIVYNKVPFGREVLSNLHPGDSYTDGSLQSVQDELKKKGLTFTKESLAKISGTVPDSDQSYNLEVVNAKGNDSYGGQGSDVGDAVKDTLGPDGVAVNDGRDASGDNGGSSSNDSGYSSDPYHDHNLQWEHGSASDPSDSDNGSSADAQEQPGQGNNQQLPQTGAQHQLAVIALGLSSVALGTMLLAKRREVK